MTTPKRVMQKVTSGAVLLLLLVGQSLGQTLLTEGFDSPPGGSGWTQDNINAANLWYDNAFIDAHSPTIAMSLRSDNAQTPLNDNDNWLITPPLTVGPDKQLTVTFWCKVGDVTRPERLRVNWGTSNTGASMTNTSTFNNPNMTNGAWTQFTATIALPHVISNPIYVGFHGYTPALGATVPSYLAIDDVVVDMSLFPVSEAFDNPIGGTGWTQDNINAANLWFANAFIGARSPTIAMSLRSDSDQSPLNDNDNWFFTPALTFKTNHTYKVTFFCKVGDVTRPERLEVKWGTANNAAGMTNPGNFNRTNLIDGTWTQQTAQFATGGTVTNPNYVGFRGYTPAAGATTSSYLAIDDVLIEEFLPVQLTSFAATFVSQNSVRISWTTVSETNNYGFFVARSQSADHGFARINPTVIRGHGTTLERHDYSYADLTAPAGIWYYRLDQIDFDGTVNMSDPIRVNVLTTVGAQTRPGEFALGQNYPNPFNPSTSIKFSLPRETNVSLELFNLVGQRVATLLDEKRTAGEHTFNFEARSLPTGVYLYRLSTPEATSLKKMTLLK